MVKGFRYRGLFSNHAYYRDQFIYSVCFTDHIGWWIKIHFKGLPEISAESNIFIDINSAAECAEKLFLENKEFLDKIIDGMEIYG